MKNKQIALKTLEEMPDTVNLHDISEEIAILESIDRGRNAARKGCTKLQIEVEGLVASWNAS